jgi:hypothetical protein
LSDNRLNDVNALLDTLTITNALKVETSQYLKQRAVELSA